jgi:hypothetical protein
MAMPQSPQSTDGSQRENFDEIDTQLLEQTAEKLVRFGQQVGVTPEEMISLLDSGISIQRSARVPCSEIVRSGVDGQRDESVDDSSLIFPENRNAQFVLH